MKKLGILFISFLCWATPLWAVGPPLVVGIPSFLPPFVMQGAKNQVFGFDINMMNSLCDKIQRTCVYKIMRFDELIQAVADRRIEAAVSAITITAERSKIVSFTLPYMLSYFQFLQKTTTKPVPFTLELLNNKRIGIESGTIFEDQILLMGIKNPIITKYGKQDDMINALSEDEIDYLVLDSPIAKYWAANSTGAFMTIGNSYVYGNGFGIAVNSSNTELLDTLNTALLQYQNSPDYTSTYNRYFRSF